MGKLKALERIEDSLTKLPSIGRKSAERMAYAMLDMDEDDLNEFSDAVKSLKSSIHICPRCGNLTESLICDICSDESRDKTLLMVVSYPKDLIAFEKAGTFHGLYHILGGTISLSKGKNIDDLSIPQLIDRIKNSNISEVVIATNPTIDGETTALYLAKVLEPMSLRITRLAYGLPMGGNLDYADSLTLSKALEGRTKL
ncbi:MAG TPA: recombination mediator RecR [Bacilli bacterium]|nr:recombination mediator RecR [Bacilli bacterium]HPS18559.1 recombination mediator RecR [Bacilli bacterium]